MSHRPVVHCPPNNMAQARRPAGEGRGGAARISLPNPRKDRGLSGLGPGAKLAEAKRSFAGSFFAELSFKKAGRADDIRPYVLNPGKTGDLLVWNQVLNLPKRNGVSQEVLCRAFFQESGAGG